MAGTEAAIPAAPRWMRIALVVSLALNLLIAGLVIGAIAGRRGHDGDRRVARDVAAAPFVMALERADRRAVIGKLRGEPGGLRENRRLIRERFASLLSALRADAFDRTAVEALLAEQRGAAGARQAVGERLLLDQIEGMSADERAAYADRLERSLRHGGRR